MLWPETPKLEYFCFSPLKVTSSEPAKSWDFSKEEFVILQLDSEKLNLVVIGLAIQKVSYWANISTQQTNRYYERLTGCPPMQ
jgi:hypothetical protein